MPHLRSLRVLTVTALLALSAGLLGACGGGKSEPEPQQAVYPDKDKGDAAPRLAETQGSGFLGMFGWGSSKPDASAQGVGVNVFLWRASLDTISFMPIANADPFGGTILTDWYQMPETPNMRFKLNVFIMDKVLRSDGVRVSVFKQRKDSQGNWDDAKVDPKMAADLENAILTRARQLRIAATVAP